MIGKFYRAECDAAGAFKSEGCEDATALFATSKEARKAAREGKWKHLDGLDVCPVCTKAVQEYRAGWAAKNVVA